MKRQFISICMACAVLVGVYSPAGATSFVDAGKESEQSASILIPDKMNEYDYIVEIREAAKNSKSISGISTQEVELLLPMLLKTNFFTVQASLTRF